MKECTVCGYICGDESRMICPLCGAAYREKITTEQFSGTVEFRKPKKKKLNAEENQDMCTSKKIKWIYLAIIGLAILAALVMMVQNTMATRRMEEALQSRDGTEIYVVYKDARDNDFVRRQYDYLIACVLDDIEADLRSQNFSEATTVNGDICSTWMAGWGDLLNDEVFCLGDCMSDDNVPRWNNLMDEIAQVRSTYNVTPVERTA